MCYRWAKIGSVGRLCDVGDHKFQAIEPSLEIGAVKERTIELLETSSHHY